jgi:hypothetical protein
VTKTKKLLEQAVLIRQKAAKQMETDYPIGTDVTWDHGDYLRRRQTLKRLERRGLCRWHNRRWMRTTPDAVDEHG